MTRVDGFLSPLAVRVEMETLTISRGSAAEGRPISEFRECAPGARIAALIRRGEVQFELEDTSPLLAGDSVVLLGSADALKVAAAGLGTREGPAG
jgi:Trk K+ transport system NAD-binding subunit